MKHLFKYQCSIFFIIIIMSTSLLADVKLYKRLDFSGSPIKGCRGSIGDLNGDGEMDFIFNDGRRIVKAFDHNGNLLWEKINLQDPGVDEEYHNFTIQNYDIDLDGKDEVICYLEINGENHLAVVDGETGNIQTSVKVPFESPRDHDYWGNTNYYMQDHVAIANLSGSNVPQDILAIHASKLKVAAYTYKNNVLEYQWYFVTDEDETGYSSGHWAYPYDIDSDGRDEVIAGVDVVDENGKMLWRMDVGPFNPEKPNWGMDHIDAAACADIHPDYDGKEIIFIASVGAWLTRANGDIIWHHPSKWVDPQNGIFGSKGEEGAQEVLVGNFRPNIPGLEMVIYDEKMEGAQTVALFDCDGNVLKWGDQDTDPRRWITTNIDWDGDRSVDEIYCRNGIFDADFKFLSYSMNWGYLNSDDGGEEFYPIICDVQGDHREEIIWYDDNELLILANKDPLQVAVKPSPRDYLKYRIRLANNNHASAMYLDWQTFDREDVVKESIDEDLYVMISSRKKHGEVPSYEITFTTSKNVSLVPEGFTFVDASENIIPIQLKGITPGKIYEAELILDESISDGLGFFEINPGSLINENGIQGTTEIRMGKSLTIDKSPPKNPGQIVIF